ncbi:MAG: tRNA-dihydrouridine synthase family protein [Lachnospiraceae bacterium]|nr:tRNA-dihydrouridine synthase family protein [Lachnospiraceae bacterium]MDD7378204.1 tRNA-dihydrouridine synthase family protein [Lachnospiraceae bacterium]MDY4616897.1 tRNA-dihydrouridine synthase family protein [Lachnospiraceae bacterium]
MKYYFAPLEGITGYIYRNAHMAVFGGADCYYTPFVSPSKNKNFTPREKRDILPENNQGMTVVPQILTNQAEYFLRAAKELKEYGYEEVNLNLGCPSGTVVSKGKGAGFLEEPEKLQRFLEEIFEKTEVDISIKTRLGMDAPKEFEALLKIYNEYPLKELIIHPRVRADYYKNEPDLEMFGRALEVSKNPVCYNGDIENVKDMEKLQKRFSQLETVMCGRGALKNPALFLELKGEGKLQKPEFLEFHNRVYKGYQEVMSGDKNILFKMKELWGYWGEAFQDSSKYLKKIRKAEYCLEYEAVVRSLFSERELI